MLSERLGEGERREKKKLRKGEAHRRLLSIIYNYDTVTVDCIRVDICCSVVPFCFPSLLILLVTDTGNTPP
jgi:hypothetical protein